MVPEEDKRFVIDPRRLATVIFLVVFYVSGIIGGFCVSVSWGFIALAVVNLVVAILLGFE